MQGPSNETVSRHRRRHAGRRYFAAGGIVPLPQGRALLAAARSETTVTLQPANCVQATPPAACSETCERDRDAGDSTARRSGPSRPPDDSRARR
jgi:hypothetical protein